MQGVPKVRVSGGNGLLFFSAKNGIEKNAGSETVFTHLIDEVTTAPAVPTISIVQQGAQQTWVTAMASVQLGGYLNRIGTRQPQHSGRIEIIFHAGGGMEIKSLIFAV